MYLWSEQACLGIRLLRNTKELQQPSAPCPQHLSYGCSLPNITLPRSVGVHAHTYIFHSLTLNTLLR